MCKAFANPLFCKLFCVCMSLMSVSNEMWLVENVINIVSHLCSQERQIQLRASLQRQCTAKAAEGLRVQPGRGEHVPSEVRTNNSSEAVEIGTEQNILTKSIIANIYWWLMG